MTAGPPDPAQLARDWITIWQSEAAALAADREMQEGLQRLADLWARVAAAGLAAFDGPAGRPGPAAPAGAAPAAAASDAGELARLRERIAELESRLAALERRP